MPMLLAAAILFAGLVVSAPAEVLYSNVLLNPGLELGSSDTVISNWYRFGNAFRYAYAQAHEGSYALDAWGNYWPTNPPQWNGSGAYQEYPASRGQIWEASAWFNVGGVIEGASYGAVNLEFYNAASQMIYRGTSADRVTSATPTGQWFQIKVRARATLGTARVRMIPLYLQSPPYTNGAVWMDDCALYLAPTSFVRFAGRDWIVLDQPSTPGENYYSTNCVWVDTNGWLHMKLQRISGVWHCPFIEGTGPLGFGDYRWYTATKLEQLDSNLVVGLFTYAQEPQFYTNQNEVDFEVSHAFPGTQTNCLVYTIQPYTIPGNSYSHPLETTNELQTHRFIWRPDRVDWQSYYGHTPEPAGDDVFIAAWRFAGRGIPIETNEVAYMNLWLFYTNAPRDTQYVEMIVRDFSFTPFDGFLFVDGFDDDSMSNEWVALGAAVGESNGCLDVSPAGTVAAGYAMTQAVHRNERGTRYVFSGVLRTVTVTSARSGEDVRGVLAFSAGTNTVLDASAAVSLQARYDSGGDTVTWAFLTKTNDPGNEGTLRFSGTTTNVAGYLASGGIEARIELDNSNYWVRARDMQGQPVNLVTNSGAAEGKNQLGEILTNGYWFVGAANSDAGSAGTVGWDRTSIGIGDQAEPFQMGGVEIQGGAISFTGGAFFDTRYSIETTTNLMEPFAPFLTNVPATEAGILFTNSLDGADSMFYRMKLEY
jgi:hypothetical protein